MRSVQNGECRKYGVRKMRSVRKCGLYKSRSVENAEDLTGYIGGKRGVLYISREKNLFLTAVYISTSAPTTPLTKAREKC